MSDFAIPTDAKPQDFLTMPATAAVGDMGTLVKINGANVEACVADDPSTQIAGVLYRQFIDDGGDVTVEFYKGPRLKMPVTVMPTNPGDPVYIAGPTTVTGVGALGAEGIGYHLEADPGGAWSWIQTFWNAWDGAPPVGT